MRYTLLLKVGIISLLHLLMPIPAVGGEMSKTLLQEEAQYDAGTLPWLYDFEGDEIGDNLRYAIDISTKSSVTTDSGRWSYLHAVGLDLHKVFTDQTGDWGTLRLQLYLSRIDDVQRHPIFFEDDDDWELVNRISDFTFTGLSRGGFNIRVGHVEIPYGLDIVIDTGGTVRQMIGGPNLGVRADWGMGVNGILPDYQYEITISRGTGNEYFDRGNPYVIAGRIGTPVDQACVAGASVFVGDVATPGGIVQRRRFGADLQLLQGPIAWLGEFSVGRDEDRDVVNAFIEANWQSPEACWLLYIQGRAFNHRTPKHWNNSSALAFGIEAKPDNHWEYGIEYSHELQAPNGRDESGVLTVQFRYRY